MRTQGFGALAPQPVGPSGQLGKEQTLADAEDLFSRYGVWIRSIRQLTCYVDRTRSLRTSNQLLSVMEAGRKGMPSPSRGWPTG